MRSRLRDPGAFEIEVHDEMPRFTAYLVDGEDPDGIAVVQSYLPRERGPETPVLALRNGRRAVESVESDEVDGGRLLPTYHEAFELLWSDSRPVTRVDRG